MRDCELIQEKLTPYALGDLSSSEADRIRCHVKECEGCRAALDEIEPTLELIRNALAARPVATRLTDARRIKVLKTMRIRGVAHISFQRIAAMAAVLLTGIFFGAMAMFFIMKGGWMVSASGIKGGSTALMDDKINNDSTGGVSSILVVASTHLSSPVYDNSESTGYLEKKDMADKIDKKDIKIKKRTLVEADEVQTKEDLSAKEPVLVGPKSALPSSIPDSIKTDSAEMVFGVKQEFDDVRSSDPEILPLSNKAAPVAPEQVHKSGADISPAAAPARHDPDARPGKDTITQAASVPAPKPKPKPKPKPLPVRPELPRPARINVAIVRGIYKGGDWNVNPRALENLIGLAGSVAGMPLNANFHLSTMDLASSDLTNLRPLFVFLSGTKNFTFSNKEVERLREYLMAGGCLWADAGRPGQQTVFGMAFRREIKRVVALDEFKPVPSGHSLYDRVYKEVGLAPGIGGAQTPAEIGWLNGRPVVLLTVNGYGALWDESAKAGAGLPPDVDVRPTVVSNNVPDALALGAGCFGVNAMVYLMLGNKDAICAVPLEYRPAKPDTFLPSGSVTNLPASGMRN